MSTLAGRSTAVIGLHLLFLASVSAQEAPPGPQGTPFTIGIEDRLSIVVWGEPELSLELMLVAVVIALVVGVLSGLYPAWRSSRLAPSQALHG